MLLECFILALNRFRCPLTELASRYSPETTPNFDIFLPRWLAQHNQSVFGMLYFAGVVFTLYYYYQSLNR